MASSPLVLCKECKKCSAIFSVDPAVHKQNRALCENSMIEWGGNFVLDFDKKRLMRGSLAKGAYNELRMERGVVDMHTHPKKCLNSQTCAMGVPSMDDMANITIGSKYGTVAHLLYASEGTYAIQLRPAVIQQLAAGGAQAMKGFIGKMRIRGAALHKQFLAAQTNYRKHRGDWMRMMSALGFNVVLYPPQQIPRVWIQFDCGMKGTHKGAVDVPVNEEKSLLQ